MTAKYNESKNVDEITEKTRSTVDTIKTGIGNYMESYRKYSPESVDRDR
ncbi:MAG: hypothetical protein ABEK59_09915 [Halobacteria archaeon]